MSYLWFYRGSVLPYIWACIYMLFWDHVWGIVNVANRWLNHRKMNELGRIGVHSVKVWPMSGQVCVCDHTSFPLFCSWIVSECVCNEGTAFPALMWWRLKSWHTYGIKVSCAYSLKNTHAQHLVNIWSMKDYSGSSWFLDLASEIY
jgi:hypothetical protein